MNEKEEKKTCVYEKVSVVKICGFNDWKYDTLQRLGEWRRVQGKNLKWLDKRIVIKIDWKLQLWFSINIQIHEYYKT